MLLLGLQWRGRCLLNKNVGDHITIPDYMLTCVFCIIFSDEPPRTTVIAPQYRLLEFFYTM